MLSLGYLTLFARWLWLKLRWRGRLQTDGMCFVCPGVKFEIGRDAKVTLGRWSWIGHGCKIRAHEGEVSIGAKSVLGQECTISAFQHISIGRECIIADRVMMIDFDHGMVEVERPIREQGIYKRDVDVGHNVWIGYGACVLRGVHGRRQLGDRHELGGHLRRARERGRRRRPGAPDPDARGAEDVSLGVGRGRGAGRGRGRRLGAPRAARRRGRSSRQANSPSAGRTSSTPRSLGGQVGAHPAPARGPHPSAPYSPHPASSGARFRSAGLSSWPSSSASSSARA